MEHGVKVQYMFNWKEYQIEKIPELTNDIKPLTQKALLISNRMNTKEIITRHIIVKLLKTKEKKGKSNCSQRKKAHYIQRRPSKNGNWLFNNYNEMISLKCWNKITANLEFYSQGKYPFKRRWNKVDFRKTKTDIINCQQTYTKINTKGIS